MRFAGVIALCLCLSRLSSAVEPLKCPERVTHIAVSQGEYSPQPGTVFSLHDFEANMVARGKTSPLCFVRSTEIVHGDVFVSSDSLA